MEDIVGSVLVGISGERVQMTPTDWDLRNWIALDAISFARNSARGPTLRRNSDEPSFEAHCVKVRSNCGESGAVILEVMERLLMERILCKSSSGGAFLPRNCRI